MNFFKKLPLLQITNFSRHVFKNITSVNPVDSVQNVSNSTVASLYRSRSLPPLPEKVSFKNELSRRSLSPNPSVLRKMSLENPLSLKEFTLIKSCEQFVSVHRTTVESRSNSTLQRRGFITMTPRSIIVYKPPTKYRQYNSFKKLFCDKFKFFCKKRAKPKATPNMKMKILPEHGDSTKTRLDVQPISVKTQERITPKIEEPEGCLKRKPFCPKPRLKPRRSQKQTICACTHSSCRKATCTPFQNVKPDSVRICACPSDKPLVTIQELSRQSNPCSCPKPNPNQFADPCCNLDPCLKPDPCKTVCPSPKPDPCNLDPCKSDPCPKPDPCITVDPCQSARLCPKPDPCKTRDPCRPPCPCPRPDPCKKRKEPLITIKDLCAELKIRKSNPCIKDPCVTARPFLKPDPCKKADPCLKSDPCASMNPCPKPDPCKKKNPCQRVRPCPIPDPCKKTDPSTDKSLVTIKDICAKPDPCSKPDPCKKDPCAIVNPCPQPDPCKIAQLCVQTCPDPDPCKKGPRVDLNSSPKPVHNKTADPCPKPDPCKKDHSAIVSPCPEPDPCSKPYSRTKDPCIATTLPKSDPGLKAEPCPKLDPCKSDPGKDKEPCKLDSSKKTVCPVRKKKWKALGMEKLPCERPKQSKCKIEVKCKKIYSKKKPKCCPKFPFRCPATTCPKPDPCKKVDPCSKPDPCLKSEPCPKPQTDQCKIADPCPKPEPCIKSDPCKKPDPCKVVDPCSESDPCKNPNSCTNRKPCVQNESCPKPDPCKKADSCPKPESLIKCNPCPEPDPCKVVNPCSKLDLCKKSNSCPKPEPCIKNDPCKKPDPCKVIDPCSKPGPCKKSNSCPNREPCVQDKSCPKPDPCKKTDPCAKPELLIKCNPCPKPDPCKVVDPCSKLDLLKKSDSCPNPEPCIRSDPCSNSDPCKKTDLCSEKSCKNVCKEPCAPKSKQPSDDKNPCKKPCVIRETSPCMKDCAPKAKKSSKTISKGSCTSREKPLSEEKCTSKAEQPSKKKSPISIVFQNDFEPSGFPRAKPNTNRRSRNSEHNTCSNEEEKKLPSCDEIQRKLNKSKSRTIFSIESELPCEDDRCELCKTPTKCSEKSKDNPCDPCKPKTKPKPKDPCKPKPKDSDTCKPKPKTLDPCKPKPKDCDPCKPKPKDCDPCKPKTKDCDPCKPKTKSKGCDDNPCEEVDYPQIKPDPSFQKTAFKCPNKKKKDPCKTKSSGCNSKKKNNPCDTTPKRKYSQLSVLTKQKSADSVSESIMLASKPGLYDNSKKSDLNLLKIRPGYPMSGCNLIGGNLIIPTIKKDPGTKAEHKDPKIKIEQKDPFENRINKTDPTTNIVIKKDPSIKNVTLIARRKKKLDTGGCTEQPCPPTSNKKQPCAKEEKPEFKQNEICKKKSTLEKKTVTSKEARCKIKEKCPPRKPGLKTCPDRKAIPSAKEEQKACGPKCICNKKGLDFEAKKDWCYRFCEQAFINDIVPVKPDACGSCNKFKVWEDKKELVNKRIKCVAKKCCKKRNKFPPSKPPNCCKPLPKRPNPCPQCRVPRQSPFLDYGPKAAEPIVSGDKKCPKKPCRKKPCCVQSPCGKTKKKRLCKVRRRVVVKYKIDPYVEAKRKKSKPRKKKEKKVCAIPSRKIDHSLHTEWKAVPLITDKMGKIKKQTSVDQYALKSGKQLPDAEKVPKNFLEGTKGLARSICRVFCPSKGSNDGKSAASYLKNYKQHTCELNNLQETLLPGGNDQFKKKDLSEGWMFLPRMHCSMTDLLEKDGNINEFHKVARYKITYKCNNIPWKKR